MDPAGEATQGRALRPVRAIGPGTDRTPQARFGCRLTQRVILRQESKGGFAMSTVFGDTATTVGEVAVRAAPRAAEVASNPIDSAGQQLQRLEPNRPPTVHRLNPPHNALNPDRVGPVGIPV